MTVSCSAFSVAAGFLTVRNPAATENAAVAAGFLTVRNPAATEHAEQSFNFGFGTVPRGQSDLSL